MGEVEDALSNLEIKISPWLATDSPLLSPTQKVKIQTALLGHTEKELWPWPDEVLPRQTVLDHFEGLLGRIRGTMHSWAREDRWNPDLPKQGDDRRKDVATKEQVIRSMRKRGILK